jgi:rhodanese-related sulfurtransferase
MTAQELSAKARGMVKAGAVLLDVRTREEFARGHLDAAKNIPVQELQQRVAEVGPATTSVVVHCHAGQRSRMATQILRAAGFQDVLDIGTMQAY